MLQHLLPPERNAAVGVERNDCIATLHYDRLNHGIGKRRRITIVWWTTRNWTNEMNIAHDAILRYRSVHFGGALFRSMNDSNTHPLRAFCEHHLCSGTYHPMEPSAREIKRCSARDYVVFLSVSSPRFNTPLVGNGWFYRLFTTPHQNSVCWNQVARWNTITCFDHKMTETTFPLFHAS